MDGADERNNHQGWTKMASWIVEVNEELSKWTESKNTQGVIYRRPVNASEKKDSFVYTPRIVSFGPYHHDNKSCQKTNEIKKCALIRFLKRSDKNIDVYVKDLWEDVENLKREYNQLDWHHDDAAFLQLMILDGCFFLEMLLEVDNEQGHFGYYSRQLHIMHGISPIELVEYSKHDMLLLENQLPMKLLVKLFAVQNNKTIQEAKKDLYKLMLRFIDPSLSDIAEILLKKNQECMYVHVLDLYRQCLLCPVDDRSSDVLDSFKRKWRSLLYPFTSNPSCASIMCIPLMTLLFLISLLVVLPTIVIMGIIINAVQVLRHFSKTARVADVHFIIPSATELHKLGLGVKLKRTNSLLDISFGGRHLKLPRIYIYGASESTFLNILAFEQLHADAKNEVTSYIFLMSRLIQVADDVRLLQLRGILHTTLPGNQVVDLFKRLIKDAPHDPSTFFSKNLRTVAKGLTHSYHMRMNSAWRRDLWQTYLKSPWSVISVIAAFFLFTLSTIQTVYSILGYHKPK